MKAILKGKNSDNNLRKSCELGKTPKPVPNFDEVKIMKDAKTEKAFEEFFAMKKKIGEGCHSSVYKCWERATH